jgi:hypothetical protein
MSIFRLMVLGLMSLPFFSFGQMPSCYRDLETNFFKPNLVNETLSLHSISQSNWALINEELQRNVLQVPRMVRERASHMHPNPFEPFQPQAASALLRTVLLEVLSNSLAVFHITNQNQIEEMYQYIRERQSQLFLSCLGDEG